jgi:methionine synthase / methylenetetrahydrofolate reductase(NADPH)
MASYVRRFVSAGVGLIGGCCGTTPEHIRQIKVAVQSLARTSAGAKATAPSVIPTAAFAGESVEAPPAPSPPVPREQKSRMAHALARGKFVLAVEMLPPTGHDSTPALDYARVLKIRGVDVLTIADGPRGSARMSALSLSVLVQQQAGIEPLLQYACRDRHLLNMQSDLLGAQAVGLRNLLLFTGDPRKVGDYSDATVVIEVDSIGLTNAVSRLNRGCDVGGQAIGPPTAFHVGVVASPTAPDLDEEIRRFEYKVDAGAEFAVTPPVYDADALQQFVAKTAHVHIPLIAAVRPLDSLRHAEYLANEVPNVHVPPRFLERMRQAGSAERERAEGIEIAREIARAVQDVAQGLQVGGPQTAVLSVIDAL